MIATKCDVFQTIAEKRCDQSQTFAARITAYMRLELVSHAIDTLYLHLISTIEGKSLSIFVSI